MLEVFHVNIGIQPCDDLKINLAAVGLNSLNLKGFAGRDVLDAGDGVGFRAVQSQPFPAVAFFKYQRQRAHADQIAAVNSFIGFGNDGLNAQQLRPFGGPVP